MPFMVMKVHLSLLWMCGICSVMPFPHPYIHWLSQYNVDYNLPSFPLSLQQMQEVGLLLNCTQIFIVDDHWLYWYIASLFLFYTFTLNILKQKCFYLKRSESSTQTVEWISSRWLWLLRFGEKLSSIEMSFSQVIIVLASRHLSKRFVQSFVSYRANNFYIHFSVKQYHNKIHGF